MIDSHTHLYDSQYDSDRKAVINRALDAGVRVMISVGCDLETSRAAVRLAEEYDSVYATVGIHPHESGAVKKGDYEELERLAAHPRVVGIGETGLDYFYMHSPRETQIRHFERHIRLARETHKPLIVHSRDAREDTLSLLGGADPLPSGGVFHCFTGDLNMALEGLKMGFYLSFSGIITFKNAGELKGVAQRIPLDRILIETDCPYLSPAPHRGRRNEPSFVPLVARELAGLHPDSNIGEISRITSENAARLFRLPPSPRAEIP